MTVLDLVETGGCGCDAPRQVKHLVSIDEGLRRIAQNAAPVGETEIVPLNQANGRILVDPICSVSPAPPFDNAAMDGYAIDSCALVGDGPWTLSVVGRVPAGERPDMHVAGLNAARIFTGAPVPPGANAVVMQEDVDRIADAVMLSRRPSLGQNIRLAGSDMARGQPVVDAGVCLGPRELAACAAAGAGAVRVRRRLRVALLVTGNEVREAGSGRQDAQIWDVNTPMLSAALTWPFVDLIRIGQGGDSRQELEQILAGMANDADLVVTTGGISVGEEDHVKSSLAALGARIHFTGVAMKPGKPVSFGRLRSACWLGLPGNPLSALVTWEVFGIALVQALAGHRGGRSTRRHVVTMQQIRRKTGRCELRPARVVGFDNHGREIVDFETAVHSGQVGRLPDADGLIFLPEDIDQLPSGAVVEFQPFCRN